ncbi:MAG TPA: efflux RND transporter periplasmic adaptor subunit [Candidatus Paceibacterota bacterium]|nr:efflux RND transporter periplasmic adaptor subunit [Candidatus Paceibacterota bacterium]
MCSTIASWWRRHTLKSKMLLGGAIVVLIVGVIWFVQHKKAVVDIETVKREDLIQSVSADGTLVTGANLTLVSAESNTVTNVAVYRGEKVANGAPLVILSNASERTALAAAERALSAARSHYNNVLEGASNKDIQHAEVQLTNVTKTQNALVAKALATLYSDDLIATSTSGSSSSATAPVITGTFTGTKEGSYTITIAPTDGTSAIYTGLEKGTLKVAATPEPFGTKGLSIAFPTAVYAGGATWEVAIPNKSGAHYAANLTAYTAALATRGAAITQAQSQLDLVRATARQSDIDAALAEVVTAQAQVDSATAALAATIVRAPVSGVITAVRVNEGDEIATHQAVIDLKDSTNMYLVASLDGPHAQQIAIGQPVAVTTVTAPSETYHATVASSAQSATSDAMYTVTALLNDTDGLKPGVAATMTIQTAEVPNALVLPSRVIQTKNGQSSVLLVIDDRRKTVPRTIITGLVGDGAMVEIKKGLAEGDQVLWKPPLVQ